MNSFPCIKRIWVDWYLPCPEWMGMLNFDLKNVNKLDQLPNVPQLRWNFRYMRLSERFRRENMSLDKVHLFYQKLIVISTKKISLKAKDPNLGFSDSQLEIFFWNTSLIVIRLNTAYNGQHNINHSYRWHGVLWVYEGKENTIYKHAEHIINTYFSFFNWKKTISDLEKLIGNPELITMHITKQSDLLKTIDTTWHSFNLEKDKGCSLYLHCERKYLYIVADSNTHFGRTFRETIIYTLEFYFGHKKWLQKLSGNTNIFSTSTENLFNFFIFNLHPKRILTDASPFSHPIMKMVLEKCLEEQDYKTIYDQIESQLASSYSSLPEKEKINWLSHTPGMLDGPLLRIITAPASPNEFEAYADIINDPFKMFSFLVAVERYLAITKNETLDYNTNDDLEDRKSISLSMIIKRSKQIQHSSKQDTGSSIEYRAPYYEFLSKKDFSKYMGYHENTEDPLEYLYKKNMLIKKTNRGPGRPRMSDGEKGVRYVLAPSWRDVQRIDRFFRR